MWLGGAMVLGGFELVLAQVGDNRPVGPMQFMAAFTLQGH